MLKTIIKKELLENIFSFRFPLFSLICILLIPLGVYIGARDYEVRLHAYQESLRLYQQDLKTVQDIFCKGGGKGFRPPAPLSPFPLAALPWLS
jgi:hypothetical protein